MESLLAAFASAAIALFSFVAQVLGVSVPCEALSLEWSHRAMSAIADRTVDLLSILQ